MTTKFFTILAVAAFAVMTITPAKALAWYVVQHKSGFMTIFDREPGPEWSILSGPYDSKDAAVRAAGAEIQPFNPFTVARPSGSGDEPAGMKGNYFVVQHESGATRITDRAPMPGWRVVSGPYGGWDEAARAGGVDPHDYSKKLTP